MISQTYPVLIVGAGPSGLALALVLAKHGISVRLIDKSLEGHRGTRGAGVMPRTLELFKILGILPAIEKQRGPDAPIAFYKMPGGTEVVKTMDGIMSKLGSNSSTPINDIWFISQARLEAVLRDELKKCGCDVEFGTELIKFHQDEDIVYADISAQNKQSEQVKASFMIGADGGKGMVRKALNISFMGITKDAEGMLIANAVVKSLSTDVAHVFQTSDGTFISFRPFEPECKKFVIYVIGASIDLENRCEPEEHKALLREQIGRDDIEPEDYEWMTFFRPNMRLVDKFSVGRVFLAGDAAHVHPPHGGQGLNSGVQDAVNLAWKLSLVLKGIATPAILDSYNKERLPVVTEMLRQVIGLHDKFKTDRDFFTSVSKDEQLFMLGINYRWSSLVLDERFQDFDEEVIEKLKAYSYFCPEEGLRAGDRAPDAPGLRLGVNGDQTATLFDILSPTLHTLLLFPPASTRDHTTEGLEDALHLLSSYPRGTIQAFILRDNAFTGSGTSITVQDTICVCDLIDTKNYAHKAYCFTTHGPVFVAIRPDGYIGAMVTSKELLEAYFLKIFL